MDDGDNYKGSNSLIRFSIYSHLLMLPGPLLSGFSIYFILSFLLVPVKITVPISIIISIIILGLTNYYVIERTGSGKSRNVEIGINYKKRSLSKILFVTIYVFLVIFSFVSKIQQPTQDIFIPWEQLSGIQLISLGAAIALAFFMPGYALISTLDKNDKLNFLPKLLLTYIFSTLLTGLVSFITALIGFPVSDINVLLNVIYLLILVLFVKIKILNYNFLESLRYPNADIFWTFLIENRSKFFVLASLFALVVLSTYYLYNGTLIGDQWFYHGKSLLFQSGTFKDFAVNNIDLPYPPFFPALLSGFFTLSNVPSVNAYVSINFLNIMPVLAFYYFFSKWVPANRRRASLLASALFMLSSGFGWIYLLSVADLITSPESALIVFHFVGAKTFDIWLPNTFVDVGHPDITTGLTIIALPAGFVLLGVTKERIDSKFKYFAILAGVSTLGYLSHDEFGIFVIIVSVLPLLYKLTGKSPVFAAILVSLFLAILVDIFFPGKYYSIRGVFGIPFIALYFIFVSSTWGLYCYASKVLHKIKKGFIVLRRGIYVNGDHIGTFRAVNLPNILKRIVRGRIRFIFGIAIVSIVSYLYLFSFIIWNLQIPHFDVRFNTRDFAVVPWYFYPLRFGVTGLIGLSFILSYLFRRFEKEVFVFGIIAIIVFLAGPYYNEFRFNKYIMASMAGFASLLLYKICSKPLGLKKPLIVGAVLGLVITCSSLSVLMYASYSALGLEHSDLVMFNTSAPRRIFPSQSEIHMLNFLHNNLNLKTDNIVIPSSIDTSSVPNFYLIQNNGLAAKLEGFLGIPLTKLAQSSSALNASSVEGLYTLLNHSNSKYIVLPKSNLKDIGLPEINRYVLENFRRVYEDNNYIVLSVPPVTPPTSEGNVALVLQDAKEKQVPSLRSYRILEYNNSNFVLDDYNNSKLFNTKNSITLNGTLNVWSQPIYNEGINFAEVTFRIINENKTATHSGIIWDDGKNEYYAFLRPNRLSVYTPEDGVLFSTSLGYPREIATWYTLKIVYTQNSIDIFLDNALSLRIPKVSSEVNDISRVGIRSFDTVTEFESIKIGNTSRLGTENTIFDVNYNYYYPLNTLALSKTSYETFIEDDFSEFSKQNLILTFDPLNTKRYLEFVRSGGTLVILNTDNYLKGGFSNLLSLRPSNETEFNSIATYSGKQSIKVSGVTTDIDINSSNSIVRSFYLNNGQKVAPFAIEKKFDRGTIIFLNTGGYFNSITKSPDKFFLTLKNVPELIELNTEKSRDMYPSNSIPPTRFLGGLKMLGQVLINSSSFSLPHDYDLRAQKISFLDQEDFKQPQKNTQTQYNNAIIRDLKLYGAFRVTINSTALTYLPSLSQYNYITAAVPEGFNMTVNLFNESRAELFLAKDNQQEQTFNITAGEIYFHGIRSDSSYVNSIPISVKEPVIKINGTSNFEKLHSPDPNDPRKPWAGGVPVDFDGTLIVKLNHVDDYGSDLLLPITYIKWIKVDGTMTNLFEDTRKKELETPLQQAENMDISTKILVVIIIVAVVSIYLSWPSSLKGRTKRQQS